MKKTILLTIFGLLCVSAVAQETTKRVFLSEKTNIPTAEIADGFSKSCPNVVLTQNQSKADYILEAAETVKSSDGTSHQQWHFTLMNRDGDVLTTTHPEVHFAHHYKHHFEEICKFINGTK
jgi:hypothetical protein